MSTSRVLLSGPILKDGQVSEWFLQEGKERILLPSKTDLADATRRTMRARVKSGTRRIDVYVIDSRGRVEAARYIYTDDGERISSQRTTLAPAESVVTTLRSVSGTPKKKSSKPKAEKTTTKSPAKATTAPKAEAKPRKARKAKKTSGEKATTGSMGSAANMLPQVGSAKSTTRKPRKAKSDAKSTPKRTTKKSGRKPSAYNIFVKGFYAKHPGATMDQAAAAWNKRKAA